MNLSRRQRIALELLGPAVLGGTFTALWVFGTPRDGFAPRDESIGAMLDLIRALPAMMTLYVVVAIPAIGLQAILYTIIMEWHFKRGLCPRSWRAVALSAGLGYLSGLPLALGYGYERSETWWLFNLLGPAVGLVLGLLIRGGSPEAVKTKARHRK